MTLLGYIPDQGRAIMIDRELKIVAIPLDFALVEYQAHIVKRDFK